jgi:hypothetical protein
MSRYRFPIHEIPSVASFQVDFWERKQIFASFFEGDPATLLPGASERFYHKNLLSIYLRLAVIAAVRKDWEGESECLTDLFTTSAARRPASSIVLVVMAVV